MVCHDMEVVLDYARRALVMAGGRLLADGPVREIFRDEALMKKTSLLPPQIIRIAGQLGEGFREADDAETLAALVAAEAGRRRGA